MTPIQAALADARAAEVGDVEHRDLAVQVERREVERGHRGLVPGSGPVGSRPFRLTSRTRPASLRACMRHPSIFSSSNQPLVWNGRGTWVGCMRSGRVDIGGSVGERGSEGQTRKPEEAASRGRQFRTVSQRSSGPTLRGAQLPSSSPRSCGSAVNRPRLLTRHAPRAPRAARPREISRGRAGARPDC
jgi:hypothetical protein